MPDARVFECCMYPAPPPLPGSVCVWTRSCVFIMSVLSARDTVSDLLPASCHAVKTSCAHRCRWPDSVIARLSKSIIAQILFGEVGFPVNATVNTNSYIALLPDIFLSFSLSLALHIAHLSQSQTTYAARSFHHHTCSCYVLF